MYLSDEKIIKIILEYVKDVRYNQAILIDGEWGSGKTYFIENKLIGELKKKTDKKTIYISLYGITDTNQIINEIYMSSLETFFDDKIKKDSGGKIIKGINIASKLLATGMKFFNLDKNDLPKPNDIMSIKDAIIVFDDLERCSIEINELLGFINNLVEHNSIKVVIASNQAEINNTRMNKHLPEKYSVVLNPRLDFKNFDNEKQKIKKQEDKAGMEKIRIEEMQEYTKLLFEKDEIYEKIKEKLIGLTIKYKTNFSDVYDDIIKAYVKNNKTKKFMKCNKETILSVFEEYSHFNLRTLIFAIMSFEKIYKITSTIEFQPKDILEKQQKNILIYVADVSIRIKDNKPLYKWDKSSKPAGKIFDKYGSLFGKDMWGYQFVDKYLLTQFIDENEVKKILLDVLDEEKLNIEKLSSIKKSYSMDELYNWQYLEDEKIEELLDNISNELSQNKYNPIIFKNMIFTLMQLEEIGFSSITLSYYEKIISQMANCLESTDEEIKIEHLEFLSSDAKFIEKYNTIAQPLFDIIKKNNANEKERINDCFDNESSWGNAFAEFCQKNKNEYMLDYKFFYYLNIEKIIEMLKTSSVENIYDFLDGIKTIYSFSNLNEFFMNDLAKLKSFFEKLNIEEISIGKKTKKFALENLKAKIKKSIDQIEPYSLKTT